MMQGWARGAFRRSAGSAFVAGVILLAGGVSRAHADPVYVIEQLVVAVQSEPEGAGERIGQVKSGDKLELIERSGDEAHVKLANGKDGWIKGSYVSTEQPLTNRLSERTAEVDKLKQDVARLETQLATEHAAAAHAAATVAARAAAPTPAPAPTPAQPAVLTASPVSEARAATDPDPAFERSPVQDSELPWLWVLGTAAVMLLTGFALGWRTLDRRIRRKYGGLKIY